MLFNSFSFLIFFPLVTVIYFLLPHKFRWIFLLGASCYFYASFIPQYLLILAYLIGIDYVAGIYIGGQKGKKRKIALLISIFANVGTLFLFKYFNFFAANVVDVARLIHWNSSLPLLALALPIGLSFHTFQSLSYVIEVYKKKYKPEKHLGIYALYVMFYPQLVAGPIERPQQLLPQFKVEHSFNSYNVTQGLWRMVFGLFKKMIIADRMALLVNQIYATPKEYVGLPLFFATLAFAIQIYCDFSGYTDIAIGCAQVMGFRLVENFNYPYLASSIPDFWRRWHMSLYNWFRDYVYIPLGGNRLGKTVQVRNILIVFLITGLWHGANRTYVVWGLIHGIYMVVALFFKKNPLWLSVKVLLSFCLVSFAWIFFRANTLSDAFYIAMHTFTGIGSILYALLHKNMHAISLYLFHQGGGIAWTPKDFFIACISLMFFILLEYLQREKRMIHLPVPIRWTLYLVTTLFVLNLGINQQIPFIYFQF